MPDDAYFEAAYAAPIPLHLRLAEMAGVLPNRVYPPQGPREAYRVASGLSHPDGTPITVAVYLGELSPCQMAVWKTEKNSS